MLKFFFGMVVLAVIEWIWLSLKDNNSGSSAIPGTESAECESKLKSLRDRVSDRDAQIGHLQARISVMEKDADRRRQKKPAVGKKVSAKTKPAAKAKVSKKTTIKKPRKTTKKVVAAMSKPKPKPKPKPKAPSVKKARAKRPDDLKKVSGIGPKIAELMKADGITDFASLAVAKTDKLDAIMKTAGPRFSMADTSTWAKQASLLDKGDLVALNKLQKTLKKGK